MYDVVDLSDKERSLLIDHISAQHECLTMIAEQLAKFADNGKGPNKRQRKDMTQRKKDVVRVRSSQKFFTIW